MTGAAFERLLYTDCRPGTGRGSGGGFQVQAQSAGVDSDQSAMAVGWLLYDVQNTWIAAQRAVEDFPLGFAHANRAGYGTAQSRYLGREATGGRQGNHLADCLLTRDPALYATIRPAQLWRSPLWREGPWDSADCPRYADSLAPGPLTLDAVTGWLRARPDRGPVLTRLLSVLENPDGPRVVIVTDDDREAMTWIAAATLLLPQRRALDVSFKVFSASPLRAEQRVVAAPADLNPQLGPGRVAGVFVLDAATGAADDAEMSERAAFLVGKLAGDDDPYDVVDAVELAGELADGAWPAGADAVRTGWALTRPDDPLPDPELLFGWLRGAGPEQLREHGPAVAAMLLDCAPATQTLRWLDGAAAAGALDLDAATVRGLLLDAELADVLDGRAAPADVLPPATLGEQARRDAESKLSTAILRSSGGQLDGAQIDLVLRLTHRHGISLELSPPLQTQLHKFAVIWNDQPTAWHPDGWALRDYVLDLAHDELRERFTARGPHATMAALRAFAPYFADRADELDDPLSCHLQAATLAGLRREPRRARVRELLARIRQLENTGRDGARAAALLQQALLQWHAVDSVLAVIILAELPAADVDPKVAGYATEYLEAAAQKPNARLLNILAGLGTDRQIALPERLARLADADRAVWRFTERAASEEIASDSYLVETVRLICGADPAVLVIRANEILDALMTTPNPDLAGAVLTAIPMRTGIRAGRPRPASELIDLVGKRLAGSKAGTLDDSVSLTVWSLRVLAYPDLLEKRAPRYERLSDVLREFDSSLLPEDSAVWRAEVKRHLKPDLRSEWDILFAGEQLKQGGKQAGKQGGKQSINLWRSWQ